MEIWRHIETLERANGSWFFSNNNTDKKIRTLRLIADEGDQSVIFRLVRFLKDKNPEVRQTTCNTIIQLFNKIGGKNLYYQSVRYCDISVKDIDFYEANFSQDDFVDLMAICSLNSSGYVREKAVKKLSRTPKSKSIRFLIYRTADWVLPVRQAALQGIENFKSPEYIDDLVLSLPTFQWMQKVERVDLRSVYDNLTAFLILENRHHILTHYRQYPDKIRLLIAKQLSASLNESSTELGLFLSDKNYLIRKLATDHIDKLEPNEIANLLADKASKVRLHTLYKLENTVGFEEVVKKYVADDSSSIRHYARFSLRASNINFADIYRNNLIDQKQICGSLAGLAEVNATQFSEAIEPYLKDERIRIRKAAFLAFKKLDKQTAYDYALANIDCDSVGMSNLIIDFLSHVPTPEVLEKARDLYSGGNSEIRRSAIKLFGKIGGWTAIPDIMLGTIDVDAELRKLSFTYLQKWRFKAARLFVQPKEGELERAKEVLSHAHSTHENKKYFHQNPVEGLDFYFN